MQVQIKQEDFVEKYQLTNEVLANYRIDPVIEVMRKTLFSPVTLSLFLKDKTLSVSIYALDLAIINKNETVIDFVIDFYNGADHLNSPTAKSILTPLHIAVISGNFSAAKKLLDAGAHIDVRDKKNWTSLHHAALTGNKELINLLIERGADTTALTDAEGTFEDILKLTDSALKTLETTIPLFWSEKEGSQKLLTQGEFKKLTNAFYLDENIVHRERLIKDWQEKESFEGIFSFTGDFIEKYKQFLNFPSLHLLSKVSYNSIGDPLVISPGLGLFARHNFSTQAIVGEYKGVISIGKSSGPYALSGGMDSQESRNDIPQVNTSFPNVAVIGLPNVHGLYTRRVMITIDPVKEGEQFCWNYGFHNVKFGPYVELRGKEMREFIRQNNIKELAQSLYLSGTTENISFEVYTKAEKFRYILQTPIALFLMTLDGTIDETEVKELNQLSYMMDCIPDHAPQIFRKVGEVAAECYRTKQSLRRLFPKTSQAYSNYFEKLTSQVKFEQVLHLAPQANQFLKEQLIQLAKFGLNDPKDTKAVDNQFVRTWKLMEDKMNKLFN